MSTTANFRVDPRLPYRVSAEAPTKTVTQRGRFRCTADALAEM